MRWMLVLGFLALVGCAEEEEILKPTAYRLVVDNAQGMSAAVFFDALDRMAQVSGILSVEIQDEQGWFEFSVVSPSENIGVIACGYPRFEILFGGNVTFQGEAMNEDELRTRIGPIIEMSALLGVPATIEVAALDSVTVAEAVKRLRLVSESRVDHYRLIGLFPTEPSK